MNSVIETNPEALDIADRLDSERQNGPWICMDDRSVQWRFKELHIESTSPAAVAGYSHFTVPAGFVFCLPVGI